MQISGTSRTNAAHADIGLMWKVLTMGNCNHCVRLPVMMLRYALPDKRNRHAKVRNLQPSMK